MQLAALAANQGVQQAIKLLHPVCKAQWAILIAVSLVDGCGEEPFASFTARARAMSGTPIRKCVGVDVNAHDDVSVGLKPLFHFFGNFPPFLPCAWHPVAVVEKLQQGWVILLVDPIGSHHWRRL